MKLTFKFLVLWLGALLALTAADAAPGRESGAGSSFYQENPVTSEYSGTVLDRQNKPVPGAQVLVMRSGASSQTNSKGVFIIEASPGDSILVSHVNYNDQYLVLTENRSVSVFLHPASGLIPVRASQPVQQIYTTVPQHLAIASHDEVYTQELVRSPVTTVRNALIGRLAGLYTTQTTGEPGADGVALNLRGQAPFILIDGIPVNLTTFDLEEVESVTVLKDALGTAMLGVRGSGGALLITTRKGQMDKLHVSLTAQTAIQQSTGWPRILGAYDYARLYNEALVNDGLQPLYSDSALMAYRDHSDPLRYPDVNWRDQVLRKSSMLTRYNLNASGGNRHARYFVSLEHLRQQGIFKTVDSNTYNTNNDFKSYVIRSNVDVNINPKLSGGIYLLGRLLNSSEPGVTSSTILANLLNTPNNAYPALNDNGSFGGTQQFQNNILAQTIGSGYRQNYKRDMVANFYLKRTLDEITRGLYLQARVGYNATISENINRSKNFAVFQRNVGSSGAVTYQQFGNNGTQVNSNSIEYQGRSDYQEFRIGYDRQFSRQGINGILMVNRDNSVEGSNLPYTVTGGSGRLAWNYDGRLVVEGAFGYNGSNRYPPKGDTKRGFTPAIGLAWNMEGEDFLKPAAWVSRLKLFTSYGRSAWDNPGYFTYFQRYFDGATAYFGTSAAGNTSIAEQPLANLNLTWEKANKFNIGVNGSFFNNLVDFTVEYYNNKYFDLLQQRGRNSSLIGNFYPNENIGEERYSGWEMQIGLQKLTSSFQYFVKGNLSIPQSEILYMDEVFRDYDWMRRTGRMVGQRFGYIAEGFFQSAADIHNSAAPLGYTPQPGDIKYRDLNSDGVIDQFDIAPIGKTSPPAFFGLGLGAAWKGIDFTTLIQGATNREVYTGGASRWAFQAGGFGQAYEDNLSRWTPSTAATATYPRLNVGVNSNNHATSSFWLVSGNYVRLKNIELGYTFPQGLTSKAKLQSARIFISGYNLVTFSSDDLNGRDPEVSSAFQYPLQKLVNFGLNIKF